MSYCIKITAIVLLAITLQKVHGQTTADEAVFADNYGKVMAFEKQPYLHYTTVTTMNSIPVLEPKDTATMTGEFFKCLDEFYSNNGLEEIYVQDSFLVRVNHERKSIWISKVEKGGEKTVPLLPVSASNIVATLLKNYTITQTSLNDTIVRIDLIARQNSIDKAAKTSIGLEYIGKSFLLSTMQITAKVREAEDQEILDELEKNHIDSRQLIEVKDGKRFLVRTQQLRVAFNNIIYADAVARKMPSWKTVLDYDAANNQFIAKAAYTEYEVTPTF